MWGAKKIGNKCTHVKHALSLFLLLFLKFEVRMIKRASTMHFKVQKQNDDDDDV